MSYTKSITASVTDRIDMLSDTWDVLKKISEEDSAVWAGMTSIDPMDRRWYSGRVSEWEKKDGLRIMSLDRKENHVRVLINGDDSFFWRVVNAFEHVCKEYNASYEIIKVGDKYVPPTHPAELERRKPVWEKCLEQLKKLRLNNPNNNGGDNGNDNRSNNRADKS